MYFIVNEHTAKCSRYFTIVSWKVLRVQYCTENYDIIASIRGVVVINQTLVKIHISCDDPGWWDTLQTLWDKDKMTANSHMTVWNSFSHMKCFVFWFKCYRKFPMIQLTIWWRWIRQWVVVCSVSIHYSNQWWRSSMMYTSVLNREELNTHCSTISIHPDQIFLELFSWLVNWNRSEQNVWYFTHNIFNTFSWYAFFAFHYQFHWYLDGSVQYFSNSFANALESLQFCTNPSTRSQNESQQNLNRGPLQCKDAVFPL